jgi:hypothetical protein
MSHKRKGMLTVSGEWKRHFPKWMKRGFFWKGERVAEREMLRDPDQLKDPAQNDSEDER